MVDLNFHVGRLQLLYNDLNDYAERLEHENKNLKAHNHRLDECNKELQSELVQQKEAQAITRKFNIFDLSDEEEEPGQMKATLTISQGSSQTLSQLEFSFTEVLSEEEDSSIQVRDRRRRAFSPAGVSQETKSEHSDWDKSEKLTFQNMLMTIADTTTTNITDNINGLFEGNDNYGSNRFEDQEQAVPLVNFRHRLEELYRHTHMIMPMSSSFANNNSKNNG